MSQANETVRIDPSDGLPALKAGRWAVDEKHALLRNYVGICSATRRQFEPPPAWKAGTSYIDPYCGPGRIWVGQKNGPITFHDGSPLVAVKEAIAKQSAFMSVRIGDLEPTFVEATRQRLSSLAPDLRTEVGTAEETILKLTEGLNPKGLHFALLDPFGLAQLSFSIIEHLAKLPRIDLVIHVSAQDLQRNLEFFLDRSNSSLDQFAPGWRERLKPGTADTQRRQIFDHWLDLMRQTGLTHSKGITHVRADKNQSLYWLVHASRHPLGNAFWGKIENISPQAGLGF